MIEKDFEKGRLKSITLNCRKILLDLYFSMKTYRPMIGKYLDTAKKHSIKNKTE